MEQCQSNATLTGIPCASRGQSPVEGTRWAVLNHRAGDGAGNGSMHTAAVPGYKLMPAADWPMHWGRCHRLGPHAAGERLWENGRQGAESSSSDSPTEAMWAGRRAGSPDWRLEGVFSPRGSNSREEQMGVCMEKPQVITALPEGVQR